jgi:hypothetical protein
LAPPGCLSKRVLEISWSLPTKLQLSAYHKRKGTGHEDLRKLMITYRWILLRLRKASDKVLTGNQRLRFTCRTHFVRKLCGQRDNYVASGQAIDDVTY